MDEKTMSLAIEKTKQYKKCTGWFLDLHDLELSSDAGDNAFYFSRREARDDLLDSFDNVVVQKEFWIDVMIDGSLGEQCFVDTKELYLMLKKDKIIR